MKKFVRLLAAALPLVIATGSATAGYSSFFGEDGNPDPASPLFSTPNADAAASGFGSSFGGSVFTQTFDRVISGVPEFNVGDAVPLSMNFIGTSAGTPSEPATVSATLTGGGGRVAQAPDGATDGLGRYGVGGSGRYFRVNAGTDFVVNFGSAIAAFGFYGIDLGDEGGQVTLDLLGANGQTLGSVLVPLSTGSGQSTSGSALFFGVVSDGQTSDFTAVRFRTDSTRPDVFAFDNYTAALRCQLLPPSSTAPVPDCTPTAVPLPGTAALLGVALLGLMGVRRRT